MRRRQLLLWPRRREDKPEQKEGLVVVISLAVRASGGIGSPAQVESNSHVCQCVTAPPA
jgi:hypothetical protein